jgi:predicted ATP-dependent serine protease
VRAVSSAQARVKEAKLMSFGRVVLPATNLPLAEPVPDIELVAVSSIAEYLDLPVG